jgi:outer membrane protein OmpA-like peptidoglycan-associated protein
MRSAGMLFVCGCITLAAADVIAQSPTPPAQPTPAFVPPAKSPPPTPPVPYDEAIQKAANAVLANAQLPEGSQKLGLVIDPLIDGASGAESVETQSMEKRIVELAKSKYPRYEILPFTAESLTKSPLLLIGTFTALDNPAQKGLKDNYRICLTMVDLKTRKVVSKGRQFAKVEGIKTDPTPFYSDSPVFTKDEATDAYIKSCQTTWYGDSVQQVYVDRLATSTLINAAVKAYDGRRYKEALDIYGKAAAEPGGNQLRVFNGIYLANLKLNRLNDAAQAFGKVVDYGLANERLGVKFLFRKNSTQYQSEARSNTPYDMWLKKIAERSKATPGTCLEIVGHTSPTGPAALNDRLSLRRAEYIRNRLSTQAGVLAERMIATGVGSRENLIGTGKDDASDALDRRVEFKIVKC